MKSVNTLGRRSARPPCKRRVARSGPKLLAIHVRKIKCRFRPHVCPRGIPVRGSRGRRHHGDGGGAGADTGGLRGTRTPPNDGTIRCRDCPRARRGSSTNAPKRLHGHRQRRTGGLMQGRGARESVAMCDDTDAPTPRLSAAMPALARTTSRARNDCSFAVGATRSTSPGPGARSARCARRSTTTRSEWTRPRTALAAAIKVLRPMKFGAGLSGSVTWPHISSASGHSP